jgi:hypothetical protein
MLVVIHIILALSGLVVSSINFLKPSSSKLKASYILTALVIISGAWLVVSTQSNLLSACTTGLIYVGVTTTLSIAAHKKLLAQE